MRDVAQYLDIKVMPFLGIAYIYFFTNADFRESWNKGLRAEKITGVNLSNFINKILKILSTPYRLYNFILHKISLRA